MFAFMDRRVKGDGWRRQGMTRRTRKWGLNPGHLKAYRVSALALVAPEPTWQQVLQR